MVFASKSAFPPIHPWVRPVRASWVDAPYATPLIRRFREALRTALLREGHHLLARPEDGVELLLTPAPFSNPCVGATPSSSRRGAVSAYRRRRQS